MSDYLSKPATAFEDHHLLLAGPLVEVSLAVKTAFVHHPSSQFLVFDDVTGCVIDLDLRGTKAEVIERLSRPPQTMIGRYAPVRESGKPGASKRRGPGRPKLGVVSREVTLLPRQWEWLANQPGGTSAVLRRLVDEARRNPGPMQKRKATQEAAYRFMLAIAGDRPGYEEATRALFADDRKQLDRCIAAWPKDIRDYILRLGFPPDDQTSKKRGYTRSP